MVYFLEFHWWYCIVGFILLMLLTGRGGSVSKRIITPLDVVDEKFAGARGHVELTLFKNGKDRKLEVEIDFIDLNKGEELEVFINQQLYRIARVESDKEADVDHWKGDDDYIEIKPGDLVEVKYRDVLIMHAIFCDEDDV